MPERAGPTLGGRRIGILQARHGREFAELVERWGGTALHAPCLAETATRDPGLEAAVSGRFDIGVFQTGAGVRALVARLGTLPAMAEIAARGPKPLAELLRLGLAVAHRTVEPHTSRELLAAIPGALPGRLLLQHHGRRNVELAGALAARGAEVVEVAPYAWSLPADLAPVRRLIEALEQGRVDAVVFSSAAQVDILGQIAGDDLPALLRPVAVAAIGPTTREALESAGIAVAVEPERPKMVPLVAALAAHLEQRRPAPGLTA